MSDRDEQGASPLATGLGAPEGAEPHAGLEATPAIPSADKLVSAGMLCDRLRPLVLGGSSACLDGTPMIPLHRGTVSAIYQHLERLAARDGETTLFALECALRRAEERHAKIASAIKAATAGETTQIGSTEGESAAPQEDAQNPKEGSA